MIDFAAELAAALARPEVGEALARILRPLIAAELARVLDDREVDALVDSTKAAALLGRSPGAFKALRRRHPDLDTLTIRVGSRALRWRKSDLQAWLRAQTNQCRGLGTTGLGEER